MTRLPAKIPAARVGGGERERERERERRPTGLVVNWWGIK
jgi:hypothetical protein